MTKNDAFLKGFCSLIILFGLLFGGNAFAQEETEELSVEDRKKFKRLVFDANQKYYDRDIIPATELYLQAFNMDPNNFEVAYRLGRCKYYSENIDSSLIFYERAREIDPDANDTLYFDLAGTLKKLGRYDEARKMYREFIKRYQYDDYFKRQAKFEDEGIDSAKVLMQMKPTYEVSTIDVNSPNNDYSTAIFTVGTDSFMIFTSHRQGTRGKKSYSFWGQPFSDLFISQMENDSTFGPPTVLGKKKINTKVNDGSAVIAPDGTTMYYTICNKGKYGKKYGCSIYESRYDGVKKAWGKFQLVEGVNGKMEVVVNSRGKTKEVPTWDAQPSLTADGNTMYFVSDRPGGQGETDIWYATRAGTAWSEPVNAGEMVNTEFQEMYPYIFKDGDVLFFSSNGHKGLGGFDIWRTQGEGATWQRPNNVGYPLNTSYDDFALFWLIEDSVGYFSSDRDRLPPTKHIGEVPGSIGGDDIFRVLKKYRPEYKLLVYGVVRDKDELTPIPFSTVTLYEMDGDKLIPIDTFKTQQDARYEFPLDVGKDYKVVGAAAEYLSAFEVFSTKDLQLTEDKKWEYNLDLFLPGIEVDKPYVLQNIYYDFDKADLRPASVQELDNLVALMEANPTMTIQIGSHTDSNGTERYNRKLGDRRAKSVVDYLIKERNVPRDRISAFGYGESDLMIYPEMTDADEQANRRTEFRIKSFDYEPPKDN